MDAAALVRAVKARYARATRYVDSGTVRTFEGDLWCTFETRFEAPDRLTFACDIGGDKVGFRFDGAHLETWGIAFGSRPVHTLPAAISCLAGVSCLAAAAIPALLLPHLRTGKVIFVDSPWVVRPAADPGARLLAHGARDNRVHVRVDEATLAVQEIALPSVVTGRWPSARLRYDAVLS